MFDYDPTVAALPSPKVPLAYSMAPRTVPTLVSRFTNPRPLVQNGTTPKERRLENPTLPLPIVVNPCLINPGLAVCSGV
jgi:hypothetical protein